MSTTPLGLSLTLRGLKFGGPTTKDETNFGKVKTVQVEDDCDSYVTLRGFDFIQTLLRHFIQTLGSMMMGIATPLAQVMEWRYRFFFPQTRLS